MSDSKRPTGRRRSAASRPGKAGGSRREQSRRTTSLRRGSKSTRALPEPVARPIQQSIAAAAEQRSEQRLGFTARRAVILAVVVCVLTLTIAGPVRTFFAQRTEMKQLATIEAALRQQISDLQDKKSKLGDPAYVKAQARERLGFVMPGETPYQVQLPPGADVPGEPGAVPGTTRDDSPWYAALWHTIADSPHPRPDAPTDAVTPEPPELPVPPVPPTPAPSGG